MITTNLTGNLGNHMWYYSICRIVAEKLGYEWGINPIPTHDYFNGKSQMYFMNIDFGKDVTVDGKDQNGLNTYVGINNTYSDKHKHYAGCLINMYDPNVFNIDDNTMVHLISQSEDYLIERKPDITEWFTINDGYEKRYQNLMLERGIILDDNTCVINFRGGEYRGIKNLIAEKEYWSNSINHMLSVNPNMKFIVITDDENAARQYIGDYPYHHVDVGFDFYVVNQSKYLILSNSSFGWWAGWLNQKTKITIAPKYWSQHNVSDGYWGLGDQYSRCFNYMDRNGELLTYDTCKIEAINYYKSKNLI
jgi:hypothetical protein